MSAWPGNSLTGMADSLNRASPPDGLEHQNEVRTFIRLAPTIFPPNEPALFCGIDKGAALRNFPKYFARLISTTGIAVMLILTGSAVGAQSTNQDNSTFQDNSNSDVLRAIVRTTTLDPLLESSSLQDPQKPPKDRKPPDQCGVTSAKQCFKDLLNDQKGIWTSPFRIKPHDAEWLLPFAAATAVTIH